jgi:hypothetical protein
MVTPRVAGHNQATFTLGAAMADKEMPFGKLVPGFEFLQGLVKGAGQALPGLPSIGQWVAPTLNPEELEKRIEELRTVQFWLEQNARMLDATIQALEVQRMTLSTLKTMNVPLAELREALRARVPGASAATPARKKGARKTSHAELATPGAVDPMQWWSALTKQFTQLAAGAMKDSAGEAAKAMAGAMVKQSFEAAEQTLKRAVSAPVKVAGAVVKVARASTRAPSRGNRTAPVRKSRT